MQMPKLEDLRSEYETLFASLTINPAHATEVKKIVDKIVSNRSIYEAIMVQTGVPWQIIGVIHNMEGSLRLNSHLHNGDPLTARTVHVPAGRPKTGQPPFTFEESAVDAIKQKKYDGLSNWGIAETLYRLESYNGFGYHGKGINSPYLWSYCNHYTKGKYTSDNHYDPNAVSKQCGAAVLLGYMVQNGIFTFNALPKPLVVAVNGVKTDVPAFVQKGNSWIGARKLTAHIPGLVLVTANPAPFEITMLIGSGANEKTRTFPARLVSGVGYVDASDLVRDFAGWSIALEDGGHRLAMSK